MRKPNVLYLFADQLSAAALNMYGGINPVSTPNLDELAAMGVRFDRSYCVTPQCSPSRSAILTGLYPHKTGVIGNIETPLTKELDPEIPNIGKTLRGYGYRTAYFGKWHLGDVPVREYGFDDTAAFHDDDGETAAHALRFLERASATEPSRPWFCMVSFNDPHDIYHVAEDKLRGVPLATEGMALPGSFADDLAAKPAAQRQFRDEDQGRPLKDYTEDDWRYYLAYYSRLVENIDRLVGRILSKLKATGQEKRTLVVFTSDHGDLMAAHRAPFKGPMLYEELARIPLVFRWPGVLPEGQSRKALTVNADHFPTILDLLEYKIPERVDGVSLKENLFSGESRPRDSVVMQYYSKQIWINPIRSLVNDRYKYNRYRSGEEELYDLSADPGETANLADDPAYRAVKVRLDAELLEWMERQRDPFFSYTRTDREGQPIQDFH